MTIDRPTLPYADLSPKDETFTNPRQFSGLDAESLRELACAIGLHGLLNAIRVREDGVILAGQRRYFAIGLLIAAPAALAALVGADPALFERRGRELQAAVPVVFDDGGDDDGVAMADNFGRADLSTYEIAAKLAEMQAQKPGTTGAELARRIGKSPTYVSRMLSAWKGAGPELKAVWRSGEIAYDTVKQIAELPIDEQPAAIAGGKPRGSHGRPGIDIVKDVLHAAEEHYGVDGSRRLGRSYAQGALDALRWVTGQQASAQFADFIQAADADTEAAGDA